MKVEILKDDKGHSIGWTMSPENETERKKLETIRDLQFWGFDDTAIVYAGRKGGDHPEKDPLVQLKWNQRKHDFSHKEREHNRRMREQREREERAKS